MAGMAGRMPNSSARRAKIHWCAIRRAKRSCWPGFHRRRPGIPDISWLSGEGRRILV